MLVNRKWLLRGVIGVLAAVFLWGAFEFSPDRQVKKAMSAFLDAASDRNYKKMGQMMAPDYRDQWGSDKEQALRLCSDGLQNFLVLQIAASDVRVVRQGRQATVSAQLKMLGGGNAIGQLIMDHINGLTGEFRFAWKRQSWKPWDWKLASMSQPEITFDPTSLP